MTRRFKVAGCDFENPDVIDLPRISMSTPDELLILDNSKLRFTGSWAIEVLYGLPWPIFAVYPMSTHLDRSQKVVPSQLSFLAIYNPSLGPTDETVRDQIVFYGTREQQDDIVKKGESGPTQDEESAEDENGRLRQVGLAQGMVDFVNAPVDSIETEKSRLVLHELEPGWWILASVNLTRLPIARPAGPNDGSGKASVEYSSREVSPAQLMVKQLTQAHAIFLLHHGPSLQDLFNRYGRALFCTHIERFWNTFIRDWDVLLHGNPAVNIYNGIKLAGGGELGVGVGEEEWGSGEREVLEDFVSRTDGLVDLLVSRFGEAPAATESTDSAVKETKAASQPDAWLGMDADARASDGVIFSGVGSMSRRSVATISQWIEAIFKNGEATYGVGENPSSRSRRRKRQQSPKLPVKDVKPAQETRPRVQSPRGRAPNLRRKAMENNSTPPGIPPPLVASVERSLEQATAKAKSRETSSSPGPKGSGTENEAESSLFASENMLKYLKLGYGSAWTLSPSGLPGNQPEDSNSSQKATDSDQAQVGTESNKEGSSKTPNTESEDPLQHVDPTPEVSDNEQPPFVQRLEQSIGKFIIGLVGDLENTEFDKEEEQGPDDSSKKRKNRASPRIFLRTITVEKSGPEVGDSQYRPGSRLSDGSKAKISLTSAGNSVDGAQEIVTHQKLQVAVYVHQPFIFAFLFGLHTPSLSMPTFYRNIHHQLGPLQKPLLKSTNPTKVAERIQNAMGQSASTTSPIMAGASGPTIYDIISDPLKLTIRTSIPNIPVPGSLAAEGISSRSSSVTVSGSWYTLGIPISSSSSSPSNHGTSNLVKTDWTRVEALNVHSQILNTWSATRAGNELERTVKTGRGWWVLWMQIPSTSAHNKEAFLIRKASDHRVEARREKDASSSGKWLLRDQMRDPGGSPRSPGSGVTTTTAVVSEGVGVDARKWVEGLLHFV